jgi:hypothetical protein
MGTIELAPWDPVGLSDHVVTRSFAADMVMLDVNTGRHYGLDPIGGRMLDALLGHGSIGAAAGALSAAGWGAEADVARDLTTFCRDLGQLGLLACGHRTG